MNSTDVKETPDVTMIYVKPEEPSNFAQLVRYHAQISSELPELLSKLVNTGRKEDALNLLVQWGTHVKANSVVWKEAKELLS